MMLDFLDAQTLSIIFAGLMALAAFIYTVLDGYDMGIGMLTSGCTEKERDIMMASIAPFWDANETWLVLAVGILLIAFPGAQGVVLSGLYLPVAALLMGLILRGVSFEFRSKGGNKDFWDRIFGLGSATMAFMQGFIFGGVFLGFLWTGEGLAFCTLTGVAVMAAYMFAGAGWLMMKADGALREKAAQWALNALYGTAAGILLLSFAMPMLNARIYDRWFSFPAAFYLAPIPLATIGLVLWLDGKLRAQKAKDWHAFAVAACLFLLSFIGICYSFYPYIVPDKVTIQEAAAAPESLRIILAGALVTVPLILGYTFYAYKVFHGKTRDTLY